MRKGVNNNNPTQAPDYLRNTTSPSDSVNHLNLPQAPDYHTGYNAARLHTPLEFSMSYIMSM